MSAPVGGSLMAQLASVRHASGAGKDEVFHAERALVELEDEPIDLGRDADEDLADDVQELPVLGVDRAMAAGAGREEKFLVLRLDEQPHRDALLGRRRRLRCSAGCR